MLAQVAMPLAIPISNPFPVTLVIGAIGLAAFSVELALARRSGQSGQPRARLSVLLASFLVVAAVLVAWAAFYALGGPAAAEPVMHISGAHNPYYDLYRTVWIVNAIIALLIAILALTAGVILLNGRRRRLVSSPA